MTEKLKNGMMKKCEEINVSQKEIKAKKTEPSEKEVQLEAKFKEAISQATEGFKKYLSHLKERKP